MDRNGNVGVGLDSAVNYADNLLKPVKLPGRLTIWSEFHRLPDQSKNLTVNAKITVNKNYFLPVLDTEINKYTITCMYGAVVWIVVSLSFYIAWHKSSWRVNLWRNILFTWNLPLWQIWNLTGMGTQVLAKCIQVIKSPGYQKRLKPSCCCQICSKYDKNCFSWLIFLLNSMEKIFTRNNYCSICCMSDRGVWGSFHTMDPSWLQSI